MSSKTKDKDFDTKISKKLSYLLRHGALAKGLHIQSDGFVNVQEVLKEIPGCTVDDIKRVVETNDKQRFSLSSINNNLMIKANQGHSISQVKELNLKILTDVSFDIVHGTYFDCYEKIQHEGLSRMKRNHIHFAKGLNFICGLRRNAQVFIFIDFSRARQDGIEFYESENSVILSPGNSHGYISPQYFLKVIDKSGKIL